MCSATVQLIPLGMANGVKSRSSWSRQRDCPHLQYMRRPDTIPQRSELQNLAALFILLFCATFVGAQQVQPAQSAAAAGQQPATSSSQPTASGIHREGTDNVLVDASGVPLEDQSGKSI